MSSNVFFEQNGQTIFGEQFGYATEYWLTEELGEYHVRFAERLIESEDPQNTKKPLPIDLVSECIYRLVQEKQVDLIAHLYDRMIRFTAKENMFDIKRQIREIQKSLIHISNEASCDVKSYLQNAIWDAIKGMPTH